LTKITEAKFNAFKEVDRANRVLKGKSYFAFVQTPKYSEKYKNEAYQINLVLDAEEQAKAESYGMEVLPANASIPGPHVLLQRKIRPEKGQTAASCKPDVIDAVKTKLPNDMLIGNESDVICKFGTYFFGDKVRSTLFTVQVRKLVPFTGKNGGLINDETGFVVGRTGTDGAIADFDA
jgi:hypothetical protein